MFSTWRWNSCSPRRVEAKKGLGVREGNRVLKVVDSIQTARLLLPSVQFKWVEVRLWNILAGAVQDDSVKDGETSVPLFYQCWLAFQFWSKWLMVFLLHGLSSSFVLVCCVTSMLLMWIVYRKTDCNEFCTDAMLDAHFWQLLYILWNKYIS